MAAGAVSGLLPGIGWKGMTQDLFSGVIMHQSECGHVRLRVAGKQSQDTCKEASDSRL